MEKKTIVKKEFKVNKFITLKMEWNKEINKKETVIYIAGKPFSHCKYLLLINPNELIGEEIDSIDDAAEKLNMGLEENINPKKLGITPEQEFIGHCSNLQAWAENNYDTRLLHSNLAFPLLRELEIKGEQKAKAILEKEIINRYLSGSDTTREFLFQEGYLERFNKKEFLSLYLTDCQSKVLEKIASEIKREIYDFIDYSGTIIKNRTIIGLDIQNKLPKSIIGLMDTLKMLTLTGDRLKKIPPFIKKLAKLEKLEIRSRSLESLPIQICKLVNIKELKIEYTLINSLPFCIGELLNLEVFKLDNNLIRFLPASFGRLRNLRELDLNNNNLYKFPECINNLSNLKYLNLNNNQINELPNSIMNLKSLEFLDIEENPIKSLPRWLLELKSLRTLCISKTLKKKENTFVEKSKKKRIKIWS